MRGRGSFITRPARPHPVASKKPGSKEESGPPRAEITVHLGDAQAERALKGAKVVTPQDLARQAGVKVSAANAYLRRALAEGKVVEAGGYSGHRLYRPA